MPQDEEQAFGHSVGTVGLGSDGLVVANDLTNDKCEKFFSKIRVQMCVSCQLAQAFDLPGFPIRVCGWQAGTRLEFANSLGAAEPLCQHMNQGGVDIVDAGTQALKFCEGGRAVRSH